MAALPLHDDAVFIRAYLDQGKRHPRQQRTTTVLQRIADFTAQNAEKPYASWWAVATHAVLE